jgi:DNA-binding SARP family transcriptional activator
MLVSLQQTVVHQFKELPDNIRLVILNPNFAQQTILLDAILGQSPAVYVCLTGTRLDNNEIERQILAAVQAQSPDIALKDVPLLVIDECDRATINDLNSFLPTLVFELTRSRVILMGRRVPSVIVEHERLREVTRFIPHDEGLMLWDYARQGTSGMALLEVRALGSGRVLLNGRPVENWDGVLPRSLFFYLVDRGMTTRGEIFETFWPNLSIREATNVFHVTKRKISEVLGMDLTAYWSGFYRISSEVNLSYDAARFSETVQESAVVASDEAAHLLARAISLYSGDFLRKIDMAWVEKRRQDLQQTHAEALVGLAKIHERDGQQRHALGLYLRALSTNPQREDLTQNVMRLYREMDLHGDALRAYQRLERELKESLNVNPASHLRELANDIRSEMDGRSH